MIKTLLKILFRKEFYCARQEYVEEARQLLDDAKKTSKKKYVKYERFDLLGELFLSNISQIIDNRYLLCWLNERRDEYDRLIKYGSTENRDMNIGRSMAIDELLIDMDNFAIKYNELLKENENEQQII